MKIRWLIGIVAVSAFVRWLASADHNISEDPFVVVESAKHLLQTGLYRIPSIGGSGAAIRWSMPSWPAGFPVLLAGVFKALGPTESVARGVTIALAALLPALTAHLAYTLTNRRRLALIAGGLAAFHPLAVAFAGQMFTNNMSVTLLAAWLAVLAAATIDRERGTFVALSELLTSPHRRRGLVLAAGLFGLALSARDTDVILSLPAVYLLYRAGALNLRALLSHWRQAVPVGVAAVVAFTVGWGPGWYFNLVNFGSPFVSAHYETHIRLSPEYLVRGSGAFFGLPGLVVMAIAIAIFQLPVLLGIGQISRRGLLAAAAAMAALIALPLLLVNGAFPVASNGAAPRYVLPLVPFACLFAAEMFDRFLTKPRRVATGLIAAALLAWQVLLFWPPSVLFEWWPRFAYLAFYSPVYVAHPYHNYPDHTNAMVRWVQANTPANTLVVTPSRAQHFFYYGPRDVCILDVLTPADWAGHIATRPVYFVEDRDVARRPEEVEALRTRLAAVHLSLVEAGQVEVFTPEAGLIQMRVYRVQAGNGSATRP